MRPSLACALSAFSLGFVLTPAGAQYYYYPTPGYANGYPNVAGYYGYPANMPGYQPAYPACYSCAAQPMVWAPVQHTAPVPKPAPAVIDSKTGWEKVSAQPLPERKRVLFRTATRSQDGKAEPKEEKKPGAEAMPAEPKEEKKPGAEAMPAEPKLPDMPRGPQAPQQPAGAAAPAAQPPAALTPSAAFGEAVPAGTETPSGYSPTMLGDSIAYFSTGVFNIDPRLALTGIPPGPLFIPPYPGLPAQPATAVLSAAAGLAGSAFKITDNEGAQPQDRIFLNFNYFSGVYHSLRPGDFPRLRFTRALLGTERAFWGNDASVGIRVPIFQLDDSLGATSNPQLGDVTLIGKYAFFREDGGSLLSGGLALTLPTGPSLPVFQVFPINAGAGVLFPTLMQVDSINPTIIQPWAGGLFRANEDAYVQGFTSVALSTDDSVPTVVFADIGAGYTVYRGNGITIIPTVEEHFTAGLGQRGSQGFPIGVIDTIVTTIGTHLVFRNNAVLTLGYEFPVTGPQPFASELVAQFNLLR